MKKFLKILLIIVGIVFLIFAALICIGLFVDYDDHIENGRYTYVPEEENKGNEYIEFKLTDNGKDDSKLTYYNSIEEAIIEASNPVPKPLLGHRCRSSQEITGSPTPFSTSNHYLWICPRASFSLSNPNIAA